MQIQVHTDSSLDLDARFNDHVQDTVQSSMDRFAARLTRLEAHFADENQHKGGVDDKRCTLEARPRNHPPVVVSHHAGTPHDALSGAIDKMRARLDHTFGRLDTHR